MTLAQLVLCIRSECVGAMQIQEMLVLDDGFGIISSLEEGLRPFHDHMGIVILLDRITDEDALVCGAERLIARSRRLGGT